MSVLGALEPARVMHYFEEICAYRMVREIRKKSVIIVFLLQKSITLLICRMNITM